MAKKRAGPRGNAAGASTEQTLLNAVLADPEDDTPRLAYADWLAENGQPDRAEFIRLQLERARQPHPQSHTPGARESALLTAHRQEWLPQVRQLGREYFDFHRGFPEQARYVEMADFPRWDASLWQVAPVIDVQFTDYPAVSGSYRPPEDKEAMLGALAGKPELAHVRILGLVELGLSAADLEILFGSPHLTRLHTLNLTGPNFAGADTGRVLACLGRLPALRHLYLDANRIGDEEVAVLLASPVTARLTDLGLGNSNISDVGAELLASSPAVANLERLHLYCNRIGDRGGRGLAASPHLARLKELSLMVNDIGDDGQTILRERFGGRVVFS
jgi:uncharacterized protein (TIGR02996 family)